MDLQKIKKEIIKGVPLKLALELYDLKLENLSDDQKKELQKAELRRKAVLFKYLFDKICEDKTCIDTLKKLEDELEKSDAVDKINLVILCDKDEDSAEQ